MKSLRCILGLHDWSNLILDLTRDTWMQTCKREGCHVVKGGKLRNVAGTVTVITDLDDRGKEDKKDWK